MGSIKQRLFTNWHLMRVMRLAIGVWLLVVGFQSRDWAVGAFSAFFLYQAITDTGCCGSQGCDMRGRKNTAGVEKADYEEIK